MAEMGTMMMAPVAVVAAKSAVAKAAMVMAADMTVNSRPGAEAADMTAMKSTAADMTTAKAAAVEAATAETSTVKVAAMSAGPATNLRDEVVGRSLRRR